MAKLLIEARCGKTICGDCHGIEFRAQGIATHAFCLLMPDEQGSMIQLKTKYPKIYRCSACLSSEKQAGKISE